MFSAKLPNLIPSFCWTYYSFSIFHLYWSAQNLAQYSRLRPQIWRAVGSNYFPPFADYTFHYVAHYVVIPNCYKGTLLTLQLAVHHWFTFCRGTPYSAGPQPELLLAVILSHGQDFTFPFAELLEVPSAHFFRLRSSLNGNPSLQCTNDVMSLPVCHP